MKSANFAWDSVMSFSSLGGSPRLLLAYASPVLPDELIHVLRVEADGPPELYGRKIPGRRQYVHLLFREAESLPYLGRAKQPYLFLVHHTHLLSVQHGILCIIRYLLLSVVSNGFFSVLQCRHAERPEAEIFRPSCAPG